MTLLCKILAGLAAFLSFVGAIFGAGVFWKKADRAKDDLKGQQKAIEEEQDAQRQYNEGIEKDNADIGNDTYFK